MPTAELRKCFVQTVTELQSEMTNLLEDKTDEFSSLVLRLHAFAHKRMDALLVLVQNDCLWDAEMILRSIAEASVKLVYLSSALSDEQRSQKVIEFWTDMAEINQLKRSKQTRELLSVTGFDSQVLTDIVLSDEREEELSAKWTKSKRQKIEQPWSYNEMIKSIAKSTNQEEILSLSRNFTQSSHFIHADETALGIITDRNMRETWDKEGQINLHEIRLLSDCISLYSWNLLTLAELFKFKTKREVKTIITKFKSLTDSYSKAIYEELNFYNDQKR